MKTTNKKKINGKNKKQKGSISLRKIKARNIRKTLKIKGHSKSEFPLKFQLFTNNNKHKNMLPKKNFRPSLSMWSMDQMLPGAAAKDTYIEFINTSESGTGLLQKSSSLYCLLAFDGGGLTPISIISRTLFESSGWTV